MATELLEEDELRYDDETDQEAEVRRKTTIRQLDRPCRMEV
jgi:hypothetical protein